MCGSDELVELVGSLGLAGGLAVAARQRRKTSCLWQHYLTPHLCNADAPCIVVFSMKVIVLLPVSWKVRRTAGALIVIQETLGADPDEGWLSVCCIWKSCRPTSEAEA